MNRRAARARTTYLVSDRLHTERSAHVAAHEIATTVSAWLAELGARSPGAHPLELAAQLHMRTAPASRNPGTRSHMAPAVRGRG